jgi:hypothetical protein
MRCCRQSAAWPMAARRLWGRAEKSAEGKEVTAFHSITSSARDRIAGGMVRPSALAVLRLMTNSNVVGCTTGRSAGLAPLRILPA